MQGVGGRRRTTVTGVHRAVRAARSVPTPTPSWYTSEAPNASKNRSFLYVWTALAPWVLAAHSGPCKYASEMARFLEKSDDTRTLPPLCDTRRLWAFLALAGAAGDDRAA